MTEGQSAGVTVLDWRLLATNGNKGGIPHLPQTSPEPTAAPGGTFIWHQQDFKTTCGMNVFIKLFLVVATIHAVQGFSLSRLTEFLFYMGLCS